jgi:hypothetical protein
LADGSERFSAAMAVLNLLLRPFTTVALYRVYVERANAVGATVPTIFGESFYYVNVCWNVAVCCLMSYFFNFVVLVYALLLQVWVRHREPHMKTLVVQFTRVCPQMSPVLPASHHHHTTAETLSV